MKNLILALAVSTFFFSTVFANLPALTAVEAATIAQADLDQRGLQGRIFIAQIIYKKGGFGTQEHWEVLWNETFPAQTEGRNEFAIQITMDGNYKRSIK